MRHGFCCHGGFGYHSFHSGIPFVRIVMEVVCIFFRFVGCDSVFLEYSRIDVFASLELLLTFCYSDWSTSLGFSLLYSRMCVEIIPVLEVWRFHG